MKTVVPSAIGDLGGCHPEEIREQLDHILASGSFDCSDRNRRFLGYVVDETVNGRAGRIKAYSIATSVFGRDSSFDSQQDSIVRIEAGRLRRSLERYYLIAGVNDPLRITIPTGTYVPSFSRIRTDELAAPIQDETQGVRPSSRDFLTSILVMPYEEEGDQTAYPNFTRGFTRQLVVGLTRFVGLNVFVSPPVGAEEMVLQHSGHFASDFVLSGGTSLSADRFSVEVMLTDAHTGRSIWAESYDRALHPNEVFRTRDDVASAIAGTLGQPYGVLFGTVAKDADGKAPDLMASLHSVNTFYKYWRTYDPKMLGSVIAGLETAIRTDPDYAEAFICLSLAKSNSVRFGLMEQPEALDGLKQARELALHGIELAPQSSRGYFAMGIACWFSGDVKGCIEMLETGLALNPNDTETMAELGMRRALRGDWAQAVPLLETAYRRNPALPSAFRVGLSLWHYVHGRYEDAFSEAVRVDAQEIINTHLLRVVSAARLGRKAEADLAVARMRDLHPDYEEHVQDDLLCRNLAPDVVEALVSGLRDAGYLARTARGVAAPRPIPANPPDSLAS